MREMRESRDTKREETHIYRGDREKRGERGGDRDERDDR